MVSWFTTILSIFFQLSHKTRNEKEKEKELKLKKMAKEN